jgi:hypothetical protein
MCTIHTKIAADADATVYRRVDDVIEVSVVADDELTYIIVDHWTRNAVCGTTEEQAWQNVRRVRAAARQAARVSFSSSMMRPIVNST